MLSWNPLYRPLYPDLIIDLTKILGVGGEDPGFILNHPVAIDVANITYPSPILLGRWEQYERRSSDMQYCTDRAGNIYVMEDPYEYKIQVCTPGGNLTSTIEREYTLPKKGRAEYPEDLERHTRDEAFYRATPLYLLQRRLSLLCGIEKRRISVFVQV